MTNKPHVRVRRSSAANLRCVMVMQEGRGGARQWRAGGGLLLPL